MTITLPDPGGRFMSMMAVDQDHRVCELDYGVGVLTPAQLEGIDTRYQVRRCL
jgi:hypothetical protein